MVALDRGHPDPLGSKRMELGSHIKEHRTELGLSQDDLAERIYVSRQTISNWECGRTYPDVQSLLLLSNVFGVTPVESHHVIDASIVPSKVFIFDPHGAKSSCQKALYTTSSWEKNGPQRRMPPGTGWCV